MIEPTIKSINFHLWEPCNMRCGFCFARFQDVKSTILPKGHLDREGMIRIVDSIIEYGFEKITFVGGEPLLCPWIDELIIRAKHGGLTTMVVTNGSKVTTSWLDGISDYLDWITISIDSMFEATHVGIGRTVSGIPMNSLLYLELSQEIRSRQIRLKLNTVVNALNWQEDMHEFVVSFKPERWKIFQVLPIVGQNDADIARFTISEEQFMDFVGRHEPLLSQSGVKIVGETNDLMLGSYIMIDPAGRLFDNVDGYYRYSAPILDVGFIRAMSEIRVLPEKYYERGGVYEWALKN